MSNILIPYFDYTNCIKTSLNIENKNPIKSSEYISYIHKRTKSGHVIMIYEVDSNPLIAEKKLKRLLKKN